MNCRARMSNIFGEHPRCSYRATMPSGFCKVHDPALKAKRDKARRIRCAANPGPGKRRRAVLWGLLAACRRAAPLMPKGTSAHGQVLVAIAEADKAIRDGLYKVGNIV